MKAGNITTLFLDLGGVLLTNGWDHHARKRAILHFHLDEEELEERHHLTFDTYESGKLTLDEYLDTLVFYEKRNFTKDDFQSFMFEQSYAHDDTIAYFKKLKNDYGLSMVALNNEGRELNEFRIQKFKLNRLFDAFISSCYVHLRKPDLDIFRVACDISQATPAQVIYMDDRNMFVESARSLGIQAYHFQGLDAARNYMISIGFHTDMEEKK
jgi:putative hydrolase of the HAD superfamily